MGVVKEILLNFNSFQSPQFFRFNGEPEFTNYMGGIFTILIRGILLALIIYKLLSVFSYDTVYSTTNISYEINQNETTWIGPNRPDATFYFAIQVTRQYSTMNMTQLNRDLVAWGFNSSRIYTLLQKCNRSHWPLASDQLWNQFKNNVNQSVDFLYCLPANFQHKMSISQESLLQIDFAIRCRSNCSSISPIYLMVRPIIYNRIVNPQSSQDYVRQFLDKRRFYSVRTTSANFDTALSYFISPYTIESDHSLMPWESNTNERGVFIPEQPGLSYYPNPWPTYAFVRITFQFSNKQFGYTRRYEKIFDAISLVGGLIPIFMILFIWLYYYALSHFQMTFIKKLHSDQKAKEYGLFYFFSKIFYKVLTVINVDMKNWKQTHQYHKMHKIVNHHLLDVIYLYKRLEFVERTLEVLLDDHQKKVLHLMRNKTFDQAEKNYQLYQMKGNLSKFVNKRKKKKKEREEKLMKNTILLEPKEVPTNQILQSRNTQKNLVASKQFQGELRDPGSQQYMKNQTSKGSQNKSQKQQNPQDNQSQDSDYNQEVENDELDALRDAYQCYERLRREAEDTNSEYYSVISRNILNKLDSVDRQLLNDLQNLLHSEDKDRIVNKIVNALEANQSLLIENSLFRKGLIRKTSSHDGDSILLRSSNGLMMKNSSMNRSRSGTKKQLFPKNSVVEQKNDQGGSDIE